MLPPRLLRRLVLAPLVVVIAAALVSLTPPLAALSVIFAVVRRRFGRMRAVRLAFIALVWFLGESAALTVCLCLWIVSGFGGRLDTEPYKNRHYTVMRWFLELLYRAAERACGLRVDVDGPVSAGHPVSSGGPAPVGGLAPVGDSAPVGGSAPVGASAPAGARPLIVLSRHAGPGDSLLLVRHLLSVCGRRPRIVMKAALQLDPSLDVIANRLPNAFIKRHRPRSQAEQISRLARGLDRDGALLLFPEGANWTPLRWRRAIERLRRNGQPDLAKRAMAMPAVLPPHTHGAFTAMSACPAADVIFVAHTGTEGIIGVRDIWRSLSADISIRAHWWLVPASDVPSSADRETQVRWLYDWWERIDAWITSQRTPDDDGTSAIAPLPG